MKTLRLFSFVSGISLVFQALAISSFPYGGTDSVAQAASSITSTTGAGNLNTTITQTGNVYGITGGKTVGNNLYHSFGQFNVGRGDIAQYQTINLLPNASMQNILSRVTSGSPSSIFGTIDSVTFYPNANFFFINPAGILFGPSAAVNVGGMVAFTTADYIRLNDGARFNVAPGPADLLLTTAPVAAFGFLGSNPAAIAIQGSTLTVAQGQSLSLVGGNQGFVATDPDTGNPIAVPGGITMTGGKLSAAGGQINIASVAGPGEISAIDFMPTTGMAMGNISLSQGTLLDVSADAAGTVRIRAGQLEIIDSTISANTGNLNGASTAVDINMTGNLSIADTRGLPAITANTSGDGNSGQVDITSSSFQATSTSFDSFALIDSRTFGAGRGGDVNLTTTNSVAATGPAGSFFFVDSGTVGPGNGGNITINSPLVRFENANLSTGDARSAGQASGGAGNLIITSDRLQATNAIFDSSSFGQIAGNITLNVQEITGSALSITALGFGGGGAITLNSDSVILSDSSVLENDIVFGQGGGVTVSSRVVELRTGSGIISTTFGDGQAGNIKITATDHFTMAPTNDDSTPTGLFSNSVGIFGSGNAGSVIVTTPTLEMSGGARINTITEGSGRGGDVIINVPGGISISGEFPFNLTEPIFGVGTLGPSGIYTKTRGSDLCIGPCGDGGNISVTAGSLTLGNGAQINSSTSNNGRAGNISIQVGEHISLSGTLNDGSPVGIFSQATGTSLDAGNGGTILLKANSVTIQNGAQVSASSLGPGNAGSVTVEGTSSPAQSVLIDGLGSGIFTETQGTGAGGNIFVDANAVTLQNGGTVSASTSGTSLSAAGGNISITGGQFVQLNNGASITASSTGPGNAGNILVNAGEQLVMQNSSIKTEAAQAGGGNIEIRAVELLQLANSTVSTSVLGGTGSGGNITIDPNIVLLQNSQILAQAVQGAGGNISITTNLLLPDSSSTISASSQFGVNGNINIQSPISQAGGKIIPLGKSPLLATSLLSQRCAALAGGNFSSFTVAGRDSLSTEPGNWLSSPLALSIVGPVNGPGTLTEPGQEFEGPNAMLSLRRIAPPGFLTRTFAVDSSVGCTS